MRRLLQRRSLPPALPQTSRFRDLLLLPAAALVAVGVVALVNVGAFDSAQVPAPPVAAREYAAHRPRLFREDCLCGNAARPMPHPLAVIAPPRAPLLVTAPRPDPGTGAIDRSRGSGEGRAFLTETAKSARRLTVSPVGVYKCLPQVRVCGSSATPNP